MLSNGLKCENVLYVEEILTVGLIREIMQLLSSPFLPFHGMQYLTSFLLLGSLVDPPLALSLRRKGFFKNYALYISQNYGILIKYMLTTDFNSIISIWKITQGF